jgi:hypothetical protein
MRNITTMSITEDNFNGFIRYEAWLLRLLIESDARATNHWLTTAQRIWNESRPTRRLTRESVFVGDLAEAMYQHFTRNPPDLEDVMLDEGYDVLDDAFDMIDYEQLAEHYKDQIDQTR